MKTTHIPGYRVQPKPVAPAKTVAPIPSASSRERQSVRWLQPNDLSWLIFGLFLGLSEPALAAGNQHLGRLFYSAEQRAQLDAQRNRTSGQSPQPVRELRLDGIVRRSDGHQTVWINGEAHSGSLPHIKVGSRSISLLAAPGKTVEIPVGGPSAFTNGAEP